MAALDTISFAPLFLEHDHFDALAVIDHRRFHASAGNQGVTDNHGLVIADEQDTIQAYLRARFLGQTRHGDAVFLGDFELLSGNFYDGKHRWIP
jgi:hypothetical protein